MRLAIRALALAAATAGALLIAPAAAQAAPTVTCHHVHQSTGSNAGLLNGTQVYLPVNLGLDVTHNALGILGLATATDNSTTKVRCR